MVGLHSDPPMQLRDVEMWNQPWQLLLRELAQLRSEENAAPAGPASQLKRAHAVSPMASWLVRARQRGAFPHVPSS